MNYRRTEIKLHFCIWLLFAPLSALFSADDPSVVNAPGPAWKRHTIDDTSKGADGVKLGDINRDGLQDIVTGWEEGGVVRVYLNPGPAKSKEPWPRIPVGKVNDAEDAIFVDLDGDGWLDVVSCTEGKTRTVFWHQFSGDDNKLTSTQSWSTLPFPATLKKQSWMQAAAMDVDGEYGVDLILASKNEGGGVGWLQAPKALGDMNGWQYKRLRDAEWIMSLAPRDMDDDGDLDIVLTDRKGARTGAYWLENPGVKANLHYSGWAEHTIGAVGRQAMFADLADINGDGLVDVAVAVKPADVVLCIQEPKGQWKEQLLRLDTTNLGDAKAVKAIDVNDDGLMDLLFTCENAKAGREGIVWLEQQRKGPWKQRPLGGPDGTKFDLMQVLDLDADGDLDVITCEERDQLGVIWYENPHR